MCACCHFDNVLYNVQPMTKMSSICPHFRFSVWYILKEMHMVLLCIVVCVDSMGTGLWAAQKPNLWYLGFLKVPLIHVLPSAQICYFYDNNTFALWVIDEK